MTIFQIIADESGDRCACAIPEDNCARCAKTYADRVHQFEAAIWAASPGELISLCDQCAFEYLNEVEHPTKLRLMAMWVARALAMITLYGLCAFGGGYFGVWAITKFL